MNEQVSLLINNKVKLKILYYFYLNHLLLFYFFKQIPQCDDCNGYLKPSIVFFGESLPNSFHSNIIPDFKNADLLIVLGTSLTVHPFAGLISQVSSSCPRVLINMECVGEENTKLSQLKSQLNAIDNETMPNAKKTLDELINEFELKRDNVS